MRGGLEPKPRDSTDGTMAEGRYVLPIPYWRPEAGPRGGPYRRPEDLDGIEVRPGEGGERHLRPEDLGVTSDYEGGARGAALAAGSAACAPGWAPPPPGEAPLPPVPGYRTREALRSRPPPGGGAGLAAVQGLGSTWVDPRYRPGPQKMYPGCDAAFAHGGHAGGPTFGALTPSVLFRTGTWGRYARGAGDGDLVDPRYPGGPDRYHG